MLNIEQHIKLLEELASEETPSGRKSVVAVELIENFRSGEDELKKLEETRKSLKSENDLLSETNVKLFRQTLSTYEQPKVNTPKITLESIEQRINQYKG